jgi:DNA-binding response OmpR family regulator
MSVNPEPVVLIVDDEPELVEVYRHFLDEEYEVRSATSGEGGLEELDTAVDVVLLDRRMPDMSGDEVLEEIRMRGVDCRVVMVTAISPDVDILDLEFDEYLTKPVDKAEIQDAVERMLARDALKQRVLETFALASKLATLENKLDIEQLERSEEYARLLDRFTELRNEFDLPNSDAYYSDSTLEKFQAIIAPGSGD